MITGIGHIGLYTADFDGMTAFYCDVLGLENAFDYDEPDGKKWMRFLRIAKNNYIELIWREVEALSGHYAHLCLAVDDIQAAVARVKEKNVPLFREPACGATGNWTFWVRDPDGNKVELMQVMPGTLQAQLEAQREQ